MGSKKSANHRLSLLKLSNNDIPYELELKEEINQPVESYRITGKKTKAIELIQELNDEVYPILLQLSENGDKKAQWYLALNGSFGNKVLDAFKRYKSCHKRTIVNDYGVYYHPEEHILYLTVNGECQFNIKINS